MKVHQPLTSNLDPIIEKLRRAIEYVNRRIINRVDQIDQIFCALMTREHVLIQSRTGAAKSLLSLQVFAMFEDAHLFQVQASKEQQPDTYFGGLDIEELKKGRIIHNIQGSLVDSEFGFIDEIFDANDYTLRALLTTLNERKLILGIQNVPAKTHTVIAATNYLRVSEITEAILDRFIYKSLFIPTKSAYVQYQIAQRYLSNGGRPSIPEERIPYHELSAVSAAARGEHEEIQISMPLNVICFSNLVVRHYEMQRNRLIKERPSDHANVKDFYISPRTYAKGMDMLRAVALLNGRREVTTDDVGKLWYLHTVVGVNEQKELFQKSYETLLHQLTAVKAFEQIQRMLEFQEFIEMLRQQPDMLQQPISQLEAGPIRRTLIEWAKETLGITDATVEHNRRVLESYVKSFEPLTEEIHELKQQQERDVHELFHPRIHIWS